jgi:hypothetical protein
LGGEYGFAAALAGVGAFGAAVWAPALTASATIPIASDAEKLVRISWCLRGKRLPVQTKRAANFRSPPSFVSFVVEKPFVFFVIRSRFVR